MKAFWENCFQKHYGGFCEKTRAEAKLEVRCWNDTVQKHWKYFFLLKVKDVSCYRQDSVGEIKYGTAEEKWCFLIEVIGRNMTKCCKCYIGIFLVTEMTIMLVLRTCQRRILFLKKFFEFYHFCLYHLYRCFETTTVLSFSHAEILKYTCWSKVHLMTELMCACTYLCYFVVKIYCYF